MTRDEARAAFKDLGISCEEVTVEMLVDLRDRIDQALRASGLIDGTYRMHKLLPRWKGVPGAHWAALTCRSRYFANREAVTFNSNGFVGFAGWADDDNVQPILEAFVEWVVAIVADRARLPDRVLQKA